MLREGVFSAREFAEKSGLAINTVIKGIDKGAFYPQLFLERRRRTEYGFDEAYVFEVIRILPRIKTNGAKLFTEELVGKLERINKKWRGMKLKDRPANSR